MDDLWTVMVPDESVADDVEPQTYYWANFVDMMEQDQNLSFSSTLDQLTDGRLKIVHTQGLHAKATWTSTGDHAFTGLFDLGVENVLLRFSETTNLTSESGGLLPSLALKALIKNRKSVNIVAMP